MTDHTKPTFAIRLRELRKSVGLSVASFADKIGITRQAVDRLEKGLRQPSLATALAIVRGVTKKRSLKVFDDLES